MPTTRMKSGFLALLFGLFGASLLTHSLVVHPQENADKPSATESKETSSGASSGTSTKESGTSGASTQQSAGASSAQLSDRDERMVKQIAESHLAEINVGKIAQDKASSEEVKSFAKKMVDDHTKALDELKQMVQAKEVTLPTEPNRQQMAQQKKIEGMSGAKFDREYMQQAGDRAHKETHRLLQRAASRAEDSDLKNYASKAIGTVESHQQMAKETSRNLKTTSEGKSGAGTESSGGGAEGKDDSSGGGSSSMEGGSSSGASDMPSGSSDTGK